MSLHVRVACGALVLSVAGHALWVRSLRANAPTGRLLQFSPGSEDERVSDGLKSGDLVLFRRDCLNSALLDGLVCVARQAHERAFDHAGVIVLVRGVPHVAERSLASGVHLRRYDARVRTSLSKEIAVRPLAARASAEQSAALLAFVTAQQRDDAAAGGRHGAAANIAELAALASDARTNASMQFVAQAYAAMGLMGGGGGGGGVVGSSERGDSAAAASATATTPSLLPQVSPSRPDAAVDIALFLPPKQPLGGGARFAVRPIFVRDLV